MRLFGRIVCSTNRASRSGLVQRTWLVELFAWNFAVDFFEKGRKFNISCGLLPPEAPALKPSEVTVFLPEMWVAPSGPENAR